MSSFCSARQRVSSLSMYETVSPNVKLEKYRPFSVTGLKYEGTQNTGNSGVRLALSKLWNFHFWFVRFFLAISTQNRYLASLLVAFPIGKTCCTVAHVPSFNSFPGRPPSPKISLNFRLFFLNIFKAQTSTTPYTNENKN